MHVRPLVTVVDLDETLVHAPPQPIAGRRPDFWWAGYPVYVRPLAREFVLERAARGIIGIWTASDANYAMPVLERVLRGETAQVRFVYTRRSCAVAPDGGPLKPLRQLYAAYEAARLVAVDNRPETYGDNPEHGIPVPDFLGDPADRVLDVLADYLRTLDDPTIDVRTLDHTRWCQRMSSQCG